VVDVCWVHEWAKARRAVLKAVVHVERARLKMLFRAERFPKKRDHYLKAARRCEEVSAELQAVADDLLSLIEGYGITRGGKELERLLLPPRLQEPIVWAMRN
jgi:hypothetical protein